MCIMLFELLVGCEVCLCWWVNYYCWCCCVCCLFLVISCFGDGVFWYVLMVVLVVLDGFDGLCVLVYMVVIGLVVLLLYKGFKCWMWCSWFYVVDFCICVWVVLLDEFSFFFGYILYVVLFIIVVLVYYLWLVLLLVLFIFGVGLLWVVLGLYYFFDVFVVMGIVVLLVLVSLIWLLLVVQFRDQIVFLLERDLILLFSWCYYYF